MKDTDRAAGKILVRLLALLALSAVAVPLAWLGYSALTWHRYRDFTIPANLGNTSAHLRRIRQNDDDTVRFLAVSDLHNRATAQRIVAATAELDPDFIVIIGDGIHYNREIEHRCLQIQIRDNWPVDCPILFVVGNHDVAKPGDPDELFTKSDFETMYGPSRFSFVRGGNLFIILGIEGYHDPMPDLEFLEKTLKKHAGLVDRTFLFNHVPMGGVHDDLSAEMLSQERLANIIEEYDIDYFITGHHHGFARVRKDDTHYLMIGPAGGQLRGKGAPWSFQNGVFITATPERVQEEVCVVPRGRSLREKARLRAYATTIPFITNNPHSAMLIAIAGTAVALFLLRQVIQPSIRKVATERKSEGLPTTDQET